MKLSKTELRILEQIARGNKSIKEIASALGKSKFQVYRSGNKLKDKGFMALSNGYFEPKQITHISLLLQILSEYQSVIKPFSDSGINLLTAVLEPKTVSEIIKSAGLKRTRVFKKLNQAKAISLVNIKNKKYFFNERIWPKAKEFLVELKKYEETTDRRVPPEAVIYFKNEKEIVFSCEKEMDASLTAFCAFERFGIKLLCPFGYYYLPKKTLSKQEVFRHALYVAEKENKISYIIYLALFYLKHKKQLKGIKNSIIDKIKIVLEGRRVPDYPSLEEIKDRAEVYDINI